MSRHPPYREMTLTAITSLNSRSGSSRQAIAKYVSSNWEVSERYEVYLKQALKRLVKERMLLQIKGSGASGSFKLNPTSKKLQAKNLKENAEATKDSVSEKEGDSDTASKDGGEKTKKKSGAVKKLNFDNASDGLEEVEGGEAKVVKFAEDTCEPPPSKRTRKGRRTTYQGKVPVDK